ncbi:MAG: hypothetical protein ABIV51_13165 [Saprospiraceae bacterium]
MIEICDFWEIVGKKAFTLQYQKPFETMPKRKFVVNLLAFLIFIAIGSSQMSCKTGYGCPAEAAASHKTVKKTKGNKNRKSELFDKDTRKRMSNKS